jgi:maleate cis-trans isomerase
MTTNATHRFGLLIPASNTTVEVEFCAAMPPTCSLHFARLNMPTADRAGWLLQDADIDYQSRLLGTARVEMLLLGQTSASFFAPDYDDTVRARMQHHSGRPATTAALAVVAALRALGAERISMVSPFQEEVAALGVAYFATHQLEVVHQESFALRDNDSISRISPDHIFEAALRADTPRTQAVLIPGGNFRGLALIPRLEAALGKPVVTTNQAGMWTLLRQCGESTAMPGMGKLFGA